MKETRTPTGAVVVGADGSAGSRLALDWAVEEASRSGRPMHVVTAWTVPGGLVAPEVLGPGTMPDLALPLQDAVRRAGELAPTVRVTTQVVGPSASAALVDASHGANCVVLGSRGHGRMPAALLGSTSLQVATHAACPVVVVRELCPHPDALPRIVVGVDGSEVSADAVGYAFAQASIRGLGLTVVHAWHLQTVEATPAAGAVPLPPGSPDLWQQAVEEEYAVTSESLAGWREKYPDVDVRTHVVRQHPVDALVSESRTAEMVVVGSRGRGGFAALLLGSVSQSLLARAHCPVAVVRPHR